LSSKDAKLEIPTLYSRRFICVLIVFASILFNAHVTLFRLICVYVQLCPDYTGIELGIGESLLIKAIGESTGRSLQLIKADLKKEGDLGLVAMVSEPSTVTL
jgi:DNA ligase N terminus